MILDQILQFFDEHPVAFADCDDLRERARALARVSCSGEGSGQLLFRRDVEALLPEASLFERFCHLAEHDLRYSQIFHRFACSLGGKGT